MTSVALAEVADVNPRVISMPSGKDPVAFVPMAQLDPVSAATSVGETRSFSRELTEFGSEARQLAVECHAP